MTLGFFKWFLVSLLFLSVFSEALAQPTGGSNSLPMQPQQGMQQQQGIGSPQPFQGNNPNPSQQGNGQGNNGPAGSPGNNGTGFGGMDFGFNVSMGDFGGAGEIQATNFMEAVIFAKLQAAAFKNREEMKANCLANEVSKNADILVNAFNSNRENIDRVCSLKKQEAQTCASADFCETGFDFGKMMPASAKRVAETEGISLDFKNADPEQISSAIEKLCLSMAKTESDYQAQSQTKRADDFANRIISGCEKMKQMEASRGQPGQNQQGYGPNNGPTTPCPMGTTPVNQNNQWTCVPNNNGGGQGGSSCPPGQYWNQNQSSCVSGGQNCPSNAHWDGTMCQPNDLSGQCGQGQHFDPNTNTCVSNAGGGGQPQGPYCGDGICNEEASTCIEDCGQQTPPAAQCGNSICESGEDATTCPADCGSGGGLSGIANQIFGRSLFSTTGFLGLAGFQNTDFGTGSNGQSQCPPGEYYGINDQGQNSCIRSDSGTATQGTNAGGMQGTGSGGQGMGPNPGQGPMNVQGQNRGNGPNIPGLGPYGSDYLCAQTPEKIRELTIEEMGGTRGSGEMISLKCSQEAKLRGIEIAQQIQQGELQKEMCKSKREMSCTIKEEMAGECQKIVDNVDSFAGQVAELHCKFVSLRESQSAQNKASLLAKIGANMFDLFENSGTGSVGTAMGGAAADMVESEKEIQEKKTQAGLAGAIMGSSEVSSAYSNAIKDLDSKEALLATLKQSNVQGVDPQKITELESQIKEAKQKYSQNAESYSGFLGIFGRIFGSD
ncbi:MAG: hypothetical protein V1777_00725 [Candidatus Micrarchaeota archaeon]